MCWQKIYTGSRSLTEDTSHKNLFNTLFADRVNWVTGLRCNMKNRLMPFWNKIMLRKRYIIEFINDMFKNTVQPVHSRHRSINNFIMNLVSAITAYCIFDNKPKALNVYKVVKTNQPAFF